METIKKCNILLVDDNKNFLQVLKFHFTDFTSFSFDHIDEAYNGYEAVLKATQKKYDLILMDIEMPVMDGIEATKKIKSLDPSAKIIALSLYNSKEFKLAMESAGADSYLTKDNIQELVIFNVLQKNS